MSHNLDSEEIFRKQSEMQCIAGKEVLTNGKKQTTSLEQRIRDMDLSAQLKSKDTKDLETHLQQVKGQQRKSELKFEGAQTEIASCQKLAIELKTMIFDKVRQ